MSDPRLAMLEQRIDATPGLDDVDKKILKALAQDADYTTGKRAHPKLETLMTRTGQKRRTVQRRLHRLQRGGWVKGRTWHKHSTTYDLQLGQFAPDPADQNVAHHVAHKRNFLGIFQILVRHCGALTRFLCATVAHYLPQMAHKTNFLGILVRHCAPRWRTYLRTYRTHTHTPRAREPDEPPLPGLLGAVPRCRNPAHLWHGLVCVPTPLHQEFVRKGHAPAWLFAFYARTCAALSPDEARHAVDEFKFWRAALAAALTSPDVPAAPAVKRAGGPSALFDRAKADRQRRQGSGS